MPSMYSENVHINYKNFYSIKCDIIYVYLWQKKILKKKTKKMKL